MIRYTIIFLLLANVTNAQTWQWGKRGGSADDLNTNGDSRPEETYSIVTDPARNIYTLSAIGHHSIDIDGNPFAPYSDLTTLTDFSISSFGCDGTYRWSKIIGGTGHEIINPLQIDSDGNIYVSGWFATCNAQNNYPARIANDTILNQSQSNCSTLFISKFNSNGDMLWFKRPQPPGNTSNTFLKTYTNGMVTDPDGTSHWLVLLPPGTFAEGAFTNTLEGTNFFIFRYDANGNFLNATYLDMQLEYSSGGGLKFYKNPYNGNYYFMGRRSPDHYAAMGGNVITNGFFMGSYDANGQFLWKRENNYNSIGGLVHYNLEFDSDNNIYFAGRIVGMNIVEFLGFSVADIITPSFVMKLNPTADSLLWASNNNIGGDGSGYILLKGDELIYTGNSYGQNFMWGNQNIFVSNPNEGQRVLLAKFNKYTGSCNSIDIIPSSTDGYFNVGASLAIDAAGDIIVGGRFGGTQYFPNGNMEFVGGQSDFFVAKYGTAPCMPMNHYDPIQIPIGVYPNPFDGYLTIDGIQENYQYIIYNITGSTVQEGKVSPNQTIIDASHLNKGMYIIQLINNRGQLTRLKILKE